MEREEMRAAIIQQNVPAAFLPNPNQRKYVIGSGPTVENECVHGCVCVRSYGSIYVQVFQICPYEYKHVYNGCCVDVYSKESCLCFRP